MRIKILLAAGLLGALSLSAFAQEETQGVTAEIYYLMPDFGDGMIGQLEIPSIHVSLPIMHSSADIRPDRELVQEMLRRLISILLRKMN